MNELWWIGFTNREGQHAMVSPWDYEPGLYETTVRFAIVLLFALIAARLT